MRPNPHANWFVGLPVAPDGWFDARVPAPPAGLRRFHRDDLHLTVAFLGPVDEAAARAAFAATHWPLPARTVTLGAVVPMGPNRRYSALSAVLEEGRAVVEGAIAAVRDPACDAAGVPRERRPAKAHLTLARPRRQTTDAERAAGLRWAHSLTLQGVAIALTSLALYTWADDRRERQFRIVEARTFAGA